ncbi:MAG TPA: M20/M25/M40 family metallo-hydrolase [Anaerolineaceae bacterium]
MKPTPLPTQSPPLVDRVLDLACAVQQVPAPTFAEAERASWLRKQLLAEGLQQVEIDPAGNVLACLPGRTPGRTLVVSAHLDTVFSPTTDLSLTRTAEHIAGPGIGDNSLGIAGLMGLVWMLRERKNQLPGDLWLAATTGEEGLGNLKGITAVVERFGAAPLAYLIVEGIGLGEVYHRGLPIQRYRIEVDTPGGHSWTDFGRPSAVHELAGLVARLAALPVPRNPRTSLNVGVFYGGTTVNTLAAHAWAEVDLRSVSSDVVKKFGAQLCQAANEMNRADVRCQAMLIGQRPAGEIPARHPLVQLAVRCLEEQGIQPHTGIGSTDANAPLSCGYPAVCIGLTTGSGAHTLDEFIRTRPLAKGLEQLFSLAVRVWDLA